MDNDDYDYDDFELDENTEPLDYGDYDLDYIDYIDCERYEYDEILDEFDDTWTELTVAYIAACHSGSDEDALRAKEALESYESDLLKED